ncbi:hypothetical protein B0T19DRAFT_469185 [Cercophora scortea]|uniref:chitinase n=1 Tax=Cercophora scortea TaxID=314031 RepID=A0AAE0I3C4_9PEZI|nr:hypothetical protein B0T19DRAFT_469185 [Cercophora scortea]
MLRHAVLATSLVGLWCALVARAQTCSEGSPCTIGCCSNDGGFCGLGPDFCAADKCNAALSLNGSCNQLAECDPGFNPGWGTAWGPTYSATTYCPLNVCCSKFGFCGTTEEFCGTSTVTEPSCSGSSASARTIGYYEGWALSRPCDAMTPEQIPIGAYTHLNYGFMSLDPNTFAVIPESSDEQALLSRFTGLKRLKPGLQTWLSIGGWSFNDPGPTATTFSTLVGSSSAQSAFFSSLISFMQTYGFDGVDIDWEYPTTPDRSGTAADFSNFPNFMAALKGQLNPHGYGLSMTLPSSYWYMRGFDIVSLEASVDWFNVMTYDLHGTWDATDPYIGNIMLAHTNLTEIRQTMDLMWRNNIDPSKVVLGIGFYGRSFTASNPNCIQSGCPFSGGGLPGQCTQSEGTLSYTEIERIIASGASVLYDQEAAVKIVTWDSNQWVSFDDAETLAVKLQYANNECLGGTMVWAVSLDMDGSAAAALTGTSSGGLFPGSDGSTGNSGDVFVPPSIWTNPSPVQCQPPCTIILPPSPIAPTVINWPAITTEVTQSGGGTSTTVIAVPPFTISSVSFWPVTIASGATNPGTITPIQSILPPTPVVVTLPGSVTLVPTSSGVYTVGGSAVPTPGDAQAGTVAGCTQWYKTQSGDSCSSIADQFGISTIDFTRWNPVVKSDCSNLWLDQDYCVGGPAGAVPTPSPIGGGTPLGCTQWYTAVSGDTCQGIAQKFRLSNSQFYNLNQAVGANCANGVLLGYNYCVSSASGVVVGGVQTPSFGPNPHGVTIQPMPTVSFPVPTPPHVSFHTGPPNGVTTTTPFAPGVTGANGQEPPPCNGCGIGFCGGGCAILGCGPGCGLGACVIPGGGGGILPPPPVGGGGEDCSQPEQVEECVVTVFPQAQTTITNCETATGCSLTATTSTTTVNAACTPDFSSNLDLGPNFGITDNSNGVDNVVEITAVAAHYTVTVTFAAGGVAASYFGATATLGVGSADVSSSSPPPASSSPSTSPPVGHSCPMGFPNPNDCTAIIFADANLPPNNRLVKPAACYSGTTNNANWECIAWRTEYGDPFAARWPLVSNFNAHVGDIWSTAAGCSSGIQAWVDPDVGNLGYYLCIKQTGYNCWVSIPTDANP